MYSQVIEPMTLALIALRSVGLQEWTNPLTTIPLTTNNLNECMMITISHQVERRKTGKRVRMTARERKSPPDPVSPLAALSPGHVYGMRQRHLFLHPSLFPFLPLFRFLSSADVFQTQQYRERDRQKDMGWAGGSNLELLSLSSTIVVSVDKAVHSFLLQSPTHSSYSSKMALKRTEHIREGDINTWVDMRTLTKWYDKADHFKGESGIFWMCSADHNLLTGFIFPS